MFETHTACHCSKVYQQLAALEGQRSALDGGYSIEIAPRHDKIYKGASLWSLLSSAEKVRIFILGALQAAALLTPPSSC